MDAVFSRQPTYLTEGYCYPPFRLSVRPSVHPSVRLLTFEVQQFVRGILV